MAEGTGLGSGNRSGWARRLTSLMCGVALLAALGVVVRQTLVAQDSPDTKVEKKSEKEPGKKAGTKPESTTETDPKGEPPENPFPNRPMAPELDGGEAWLNTSGDITLKELRGKIVILDFWTYCCINCMHVLPDLKKIEEKYPKQVVVIGVHSAKFDNEKSTEAIRSAIVRYQIAHPVINDSEMKVWRKFSVNSWPTFVVIDPEGRYIGQKGGEGNLELLDDVVSTLIPYHRAKGTLDESPVKFRLESELVEPTPLQFPGKVLADEAGDRLFISDSNHNRIVVTTLGGKLREIIGSGEAGRKDGGYDVAQFDRLQGMALAGEVLYVADTENHLLRAVDLKQKTVSTIAGIGTQAQFRNPGGPALETALNSPWDLVHIRGKLYVCMAGPHQLWAYDFEDKTIKPFAGTGREDVRNGPLAESAFAQPSGIVNDAEFLYVVDSEGSSIRKVSIDPAGEATTLAGTSDLAGGRCLFEFGDTDGKGSAVRFQHPLGLTRKGSMLYVADSYNQKIKTLDIATGVVKTFLGDGTKGKQEKPARFSEPAGLTIAGNTLYVADTNNHLVRTVDLKTNAVATLAIEGLTPPVKKPSKTEEKVMAQLVAAQKVAPGDKLNFRIDLDLPAGFKVNKLAPPIYRLDVTGPQELLAADQLGNLVEAAASDQPAVQFNVPLANKSGQAKVTVTLTYQYCKEGIGGVCKIRTLAWTVPVSVEQDATEKEVKLASPK